MSHIKKEKKKKKKKKKGGFEIRPTKKASNFTKAHSNEYFLIFFSIL